MHKKVVSIEVRETFKLLMKKKTFKTEIYAKSMWLFLDSIQGSIKINLFGPVAAGTNVVSVL